MGRMGPERDIDDRALQRMKLGPDVEPTETELLKRHPRTVRWRPPEVRPPLIVTLVPHGPLS
jgi:hypothetical protein